MMNDVLERGGTLGSSARRCRGSNLQKVLLIPPVALTGRGPPPSARPLQLILKEVDWLPTAGRSVGVRRTRRDGGGQQRAR